MKKEIRNKLNSQRDTTQEILNKINSGEINQGNFKESCEVYPQLKWANWIVEFIHYSFWFSFGYLVVYFFTH